MYTYKITTLEKEFKIPTKWEEITVSKFAKYQALVKEIQKDFIETFNLKDETEIGQVTTREIFHQLPSYFIKLISFWSGLSSQEVYQVDHHDILSIHLYMNELLAKNTIEKGMDRFVFGGTEYLFPLSKTDIEGNTALMAGETFGAMVYAFQQNQNLEDLGKGKFDAVAAQMAILCRPEGEDYDPEKCNARAIEFKELPMDIVWEFVFFSTRQMPKFKELTRIYTAEAEKQAD